MARKSPTALVKMAFEEDVLRIAIADIQPLRLVTREMKKTPKYRRIAASMQEVGIVEPPIVARDRTKPGKYLLLEGHLRIDVLKDLGHTDVVCVVSTDDEAFTYNKRVNRLAIIQEHKMILKAIERGVSEERIAKALNVDVAGIKQKRRLLDGICAEVAEIFKDKYIAVQTFTEFKKMAPLRQIEAAELMVAMNNYTTTYAKSLLAGTPESHLIESAKPKHVKGVTDELAEVRFDLALRAHDEVWLSSAVDGKPPSESIMEDGQSITVHATDRAILKVGNAGALDVAFNGQKVPVRAAEGEVRTLTFTASGLQVPTATPKPN